MIYVIAPSRIQFLEYCRKKKIHPGRDAVFLDRLDKIRGSRNIIIVKFGQWSKSEIYKPASEWRIIESHLRIVSCEIQTWLSSTQDIRVDQEYRLLVREMEEKFSNLLWPFNGEPIEKTPIFFHKKIYF